MTPGALQLVDASNIEGVGTDRDVWVFRFQRDGQPREIHARRLGEPDAAPRALKLAREVGGPVTWTAAVIGGTYAWLWRDVWHRPMWFLAEPHGTARARQVEACPNGCGAP